MRDWPEPDQDTALDILETWDLGDDEEARAERAQIEYYEEKVKVEEAEANTQYEDNPYTDWTPNTCCCGTTDLSPSSSYCQSCSQSLADEALGDQYDDEYAEREKAWQEICIIQDQADAARLQSAIIQAQANIARITADIAAVKSEIAKANHDIDAAEREEEHYYAHNRLNDAKIRLVDAEASLVEAEVVLAKTRAISAAHTAVARAKAEVEYAEEKVQTKEDAKNRQIEIEEILNSKFLVDEDDSLVEDAHIEYVNALIELTEVKDALDVAEIHLAKIAPFCTTKGYRFASNEPRCLFDVF